MTRATPDRQADYPHLLLIPTRWRDNDIYGHVNNVVYYSYFDTVVNRYLIEAGGLDIQTGAVIGLVVESQCNFFAPVTYPETVTAGLRVGRLGRSSVRYEIGIFRDGEDSAAATGHFVHVFVTRDSNDAAPIPAAIRTALEKLIIDP